MHGLVLVGAVFKPLELQDILDKYLHLAIGFKVDLTRLFHDKIASMVLAGEAEYSLTHGVYGASLSFR